jgi:hypothetical protein
MVGMESDGERSNQRPGRGRPADASRILGKVRFLSTKSGSAVNLLLIDPAKLAELRCTALGEGGFNVPVGPWLLQGEAAWPKRNRYSLCHPCNTCRRIHSISE